MHGPRQSHGIYISLDYPNAVGTAPYGTTDLGELVGRWHDPAGHAHGSDAVEQ